MIKGISELDENQTIQFDNALSEQSKIIANGLASIGTLKLVVRAYLEQRWHDKAILIQKQIVAKERNAQNYYDLIGIFHRLGMFDEEQKAANEMLRIDPDNAVAYYILGAVKGMLGSATKDSTARTMYDDEALICFRRASELDKNYVLPKIGEALILRKKNLANEANEIMNDVNKMSAMFADKDYYGIACYNIAEGGPDLALQNLAASFDKASPSKRAQLLETAQLDPDLDLLTSFRKC